MTNPYLEVAVEAALEGGAILLAEYDRPVTISYKGEVDLVTQADKRSELAVVSRLRRAFPKHSVVAEEGGGVGDLDPYPAPTAGQLTASEMLSRIRQGTDG